MTAQNGEMQTTKKQQQLKGRRLTMAPILEQTKIFVQLRESIDRLRTLTDQFELVLLGRPRKWTSIP
jgi:hypothetical protein